MQMKDRTKIMFAEELENMLKDIPLEKVRVAKLCERCGATPPTFYYYFHDKYELVACGCSFRIFPLLLAIKRLSIHRKC